MTHYKKLYSRDYIASFDLGDKDVTVEVAHVKQANLRKLKNKRETIEQRPVLYFKGREKGPGMVLNPTNGKTMASLYGVHVEEWVGQKVTLYVDHNVRNPSGGGPVDGLRIRPVKPTGEATTPPVDDSRPQPGGDEDGGGK